MFRLAEYRDADPDLYEYLCVAVSETIYTALDGLFGTSEAAEDFYETMFTGQPTGPLAVDFFEGLAEFIPERSSLTEDLYGERLSEDGRAASELIDRKTRRMMEKMKDPKHYYTFDLFEELLFQNVIDLFVAMEEEIEDEEISEREQAIRKTAEELKARFDLEEDEIACLAESIHRVDLMGPEDSGMFFWDDDFAVIFADGFVSGIKKLASGKLSYLDYDYKEVCSIFTDAGIKAPLQLVGEETQYEIRNDAETERRIAATQGFSNSYSESDFGDFLGSTDSLPF